MGLWDAKSKFGTAIQAKLGQHQNKGEQNKGWAQVGPNRLLQHKWVITDLDMRKIKWAM